MTKEIPEEKRREFVVLDVMGGDHGPTPIVRGAVQAWRDYRVGSVMVGDVEQIEKILNSLQVPDDFPLCIEHAPDVVTMQDSATSVLRGKRDSSMRMSFELLNDGKGCAVVSPGNTGAFMAAGVSVCGTLPGIARPAIASLLPRVGDLPPTVLLDSGANADCNAEQLVQFAIMGDHYSRLCASITSPRVALLANGTESSKGNDLIRAASSLLHNVESMNFLGYVEGRDITKDVADVIVCDGLLGNVVLKTVEGTVELVFDSLKHYVEPSIRGKIGLFFCKPIIKKIFQRELDPSEYGGAPLLGLTQIAIVCHGTSGEKAISNAIRMARKFAIEDLVDSIGSALSEFEESFDDGIGDGVWSRVGAQLAGKNGKKGRFLRSSKETEQEEESAS